MKVDFEVVHYQHGDTQIVSVFGRISDICDDVAKHGNQFATCKELLRKEFLVGKN